MTPQIIECVYCSETFTIDDDDHDHREGPEDGCNCPTQDWPGAVKLLEESDWTVEGAGFDDHQAMCPACSILEAK
jgi:hypothetical protein